MIKEKLKENEPIAYRILHNALNNKRVAHSYLFTGEVNPLKKDAAFLLAQSIIENKNDFACEECEICQRIKNLSYYDLIYVDGKNEFIKSEFIEHIRSEFYKTALEASGKKIYIIDNINNASTKALNTLLKVLEEPNSSESYAIFITDKKEGLLPTIVSRCLEVPFFTSDFSDVIDDYLKADLEYIDAYLLTNIHHEFNEEILDDIDIFNDAKQEIYNTIDNLDNPYYIPVLFSQEIYPNYKGDDFKLFGEYYIDIMLTLLQDSFSNRKNDDELYQDKIDSLDDSDKMNLFEIFQETKDKLLYNPERKLLFDSIAYAIISYKSR